jgi:hypothetical protein
MSHSISAASIQGPLRIRVTLQLRWWGDSLLTDSSSNFCEEILMGRKILNRKEMRADFDAAERRKQDDEEVDETEEEEEDEDEDEDEGEEEGDEEGSKDAAVEEEEADEAAEVPKARKKAKPPAKAPKAKTRTRTPKVTRMKVVWGVFNNSNQRVATFDYPKRKDADDLASKLTNDKKTTHFVQPVKEPMEEKEKEKEKEKKEKGSKDHNPDKK